MMDVLFDATRRLDAASARAPERLRQRLDASRQRSVSEHALDVAAMGESPVLSGSEIRQRRDENELLLRAAVPGIDWLYRQLGDLGYCLLLTDFSGATLEVRSVERRTRQFADAGLRAGACWSETQQGTCGIGTAIVDGEPVLVHGDEHYLLRNRGISCAAVPLFGPRHQLLGVLNATACSEEAQHYGKGLAYRLTQQTAGRIERTLFLSHFAQQWVVQLGRDAEAWDADPDVLIAFDEDGTVLGTSRELQRRIGSRPCRVDELLATPVAGLIDFARAHPGTAMSLSPSPGAAGLSAMIRAPRSASPRRAGGRSETRSAARTDAHTSAMARLERLANGKVPILLLGETGSGKEMTARSIHARSNRSERPFVAINCAAIPENLIESELFGYRDGAFTGARAKGYEGKIALADGGTLFLDEIGDMPLGLQTRLLRVLAEGEVLALGADRPRVVDIQVICATHRDLESMVGDGSFREDLYYRLNAATHRLPPLRDRDDRPELIERVFAEECRAAGRALDLGAMVRDALVNHSWPGNIRELRNVLRYAIAVCQHDKVQWDDLPECFVNQAANEEGDRRRARIPAQAHQSGLDERARIIEALERVDWCASAASRVLGISRSTLYRRLKDHGIEAPG